MSSRTCRETFGPADAPVAHQVRLGTAARTCLREIAQREVCVPNATGVVVTWTPSRCGQRPELLAVMPRVARARCGMVRSPGTGGAGSPAPGCCSCGCRPWPASHSGPRDSSASGTQLSGRREDDRGVEGHRCRSRTVHPTDAAPICRGSSCRALTRASGRAPLRPGDGHLCGEVCAGSEPIDPRGDLNHADADARAPVRSGRHRHRVDNPPRPRPHRGPGTIRALAACLSGGSFFFFAHPQPCKGRCCRLQARTWTSTHAIATEDGGTYISPRPRVLG